MCIYGYRTTIYRNKIMIKDRYDYDIGGRFFFMNMNNKNCFFFIYQNGFRQIVMPNGKVIDITSCDDGCFIEVEGDMNKIVKELNKFIEHKIIEVYCDSNSIVSHSYFNGAEIKRHMGYYEYDAIWIKDKSIKDDCSVEYLIEGKKYYE